MNTGERAFHYLETGDETLNGAGVITEYTPPTALFKLDKSDGYPFRVLTRDLITEKEAVERGLF